MTSTGAKEECQTPDSDPAAAASAVDFLRGRESSTEELMHVQSGTMWTGIGQIDVFGWWHFAQPALTLWQSLPAEHVDRSKLHGSEEK